MTNNDPQNTIEQHESKKLKKIRGGGGGSLLFGNQYVISIIRRPDQETMSWKKLVSQIQTQIMTIVPILTVPCKTTTGS